MLKLGGFAVSNYYNKVKVALLEKGIPFEEVFCMTSQDENYLKRSPMGKVPYLEVDGRFLCESQVICEYLEDHYPDHPLYPKDVFERARVRELITVMELHMELVARRLYAQAFFGGTVSDEIKKHVDKDLAKGVRAFKQLARFAPYIAGADLSYADCAAGVAGEQGRLRPRRARKLRPGETLSEDAQRAPGLPENERRPQACDRSHGGGAGDEGLSAEARTCAAGSRLQRLHLVPAADQDGKALRAHLGDKPGDPAAFPSVGPVGADVQNEIVALVGNTDDHARGVGPQFEGQRLASPLRLQPDTLIHPAGLGPGVVDAAADADFAMPAPGVRRFVQLADFQDLAAGGAAVTAVHAGAHPIGLVGLRSCRISSMRHWIEGLIFGW